MGYEIVEVYRDEGISSAKSRDLRPAFDKLCKDATRRYFDKAMYQMMGVFAEFERAMTREHVAAGLERARAQPSFTVKPLSEILKMEVFKL